MAHDKETPEVSETTTVQTRRHIADMMDESLLDIRATAALLKWELEESQRDLRSLRKAPSSPNSATRLSEKIKPEEERIQRALEDMEGMLKGWDEMSQSMHAYREVTASMDKKEVTGEDIKGEEVKGHKG